MAALYDFAFSTPPLGEKPKTIVDAYMQGFFEEEHIIKTLLDGISSSNKTCIEELNVILKKLSIVNVETLCDIKSYLYVNCDVLIQISSTSTGNAGLDQKISELISIIQSNFFNFTKINSLYSLPYGLDLILKCLTMESLLLYIKFPGVIPTLEYLQLEQKEQDDYASEIYVKYKMTRGLINTFRECDLPIIRLLLYCSKTWGTFTLTPDHTLVRTINKSREQSASALNADILFCNFNLRGNLFIRNATPNDSYIELKPKRQLTLIDLSQFNLWFPMQLKAGAKEDRGIFSFFKLDMIKYACRYLGIDGIITIDTVDSVLFHELKEAYPVSSLLQDVQTDLMQRKCAPISSFQKGTNEYGNYEVRDDIGGVVYPEITLCSAEYTPVYGNLVDIVNEVYPLAFNSKDKTNVTAFLRAWNHPSPANCPWKSDAYGNPVGVNINNMVIKTLTHDYPEVENAPVLPVCVDFTLDLFKKLINDILQIKFEIQEAYLPRIVGDCGIKDPTRPGVRLFMGNKTKSQCKKRGRSKKRSQYKKSKRSV